MASEGMRKNTVL